MGTLKNKFKQFAEEVRRSELYIQMHPQWDNSWTTNDSYTDVTGAIGQIDCANWVAYTMYFEMVALTDAGTGYYHLLNSDSSLELAGSEITTTSTSAVRIRSGAVTKPTSGNLNIKIQHYITPASASKYVNSIMSRIIFKIIT